MKVKQVLDESKEPKLAKILEELKATLRYTYNTSWDSSLDIILGLFKAIKTALPLNLAEKGINFFFISLLLF